MTEEEHRRFRHDLRGRWNGLRLCVDALMTCTEPNEIVEFLDAIAIASDEVSEVLIKMDEESK